MSGAIGEAQVLEHLHSATTCFAHAGTLNEGGHHHILYSRELGQELVKLEDEADMTIAEGRELLLLVDRHVDAIEEHAAAIGAVEGADDLQQGGLARSAGTYNAYYFALTDGEVNAFEHFE